MKKYIVVVVFIVTLIFSTTFVFAAKDSAVTIVNPVSQSTTTATNLLISVKVTQARTIKISMYEEKALVNGKYVSIDLAAGGSVPRKEDMKSYLVFQPVTYNTPGKLMFCTKQVNGVHPGLYRVRVDTLASGKVIYSSENYVGVKSKEDSGSKIFDNQQSGTFQFLQNILKSIFGS
ncbi:MAG: hypothetical protein RR131_00070 [Anaerovorax sp.]